MREIMTHKSNGCNGQISLHAVDGPGPGGASHHYQIVGFGGFGQAQAMVELHFQNGPILEKGINGITNEVLLAVVIDRLRGFQDGKYACEENKAALDCLWDALQHLNRRTKGRVERGVEGTHKV